MLPWVKVSLIVFMDSDPGALPLLVMWLRVYPACKEVFLLFVRSPWKSPWKTCWPYVRLIQAEVSVIYMIDTDIATIDGALQVWTHIIRQSRAVLGMVGDFGDF